LTNGPNNTWTSEVEKTIGPDLECVNRRFGEICQLRDLLNQHEAFQEDVIPIYNGVSFPQGQQLTLYVDSATLKGSFNGNNFSVTSRIHPDWDNFADQKCESVADLSYGSVASISQYGGTTGRSSPGGGHKIYNEAHPDADNPELAWQPQDGSTYFKPNQTQEQAYQSCDEALITTIGMIGGPKESMAKYDSLASGSFFWAPNGSEVFMESESEILYTVSLLPGTVDGVAAYKSTKKGFRYLTPIPESLYTVYETDYVGYQVVEIGFDKALRLYDERWEDQIYVSFTSSIGPNPVDIIEWLINKYTDLTIDSASFTSVKTATTNYPNNFYLTDRPDVHDLIQDIAYQSRCAVFIRNDVVYIKYLSEEPSSERTINESDIMFGTFKEFLSETEDVYTTHKVAWKKAGAPVRDDQRVERKVVLKYNVDKYGTVTEEWDYYTYNIYELVLKSSTFWLIRKANSWRKVAFTLPIEHMDLDVGDCITLNVGQFGDAIKVIIEEMQLNADDNTIDVVCWTPIRAGETSEYYWAWPAAKAAHQIWPLAGDTHGGAGYSFEVTPPVGHILLGGAHRDDQLQITTGDLHPSDLDDTLPTLPPCELSNFNEAEFNDPDPSAKALATAQSGARQIAENTISGGGNSGGSDKKKPKDDGNCRNAGIGCNYIVLVDWHTSHAQGYAGEGARNGVCGGPCPCDGGCPSCYGPTWTVCHTYGSAWGAKMAADYWKQTYGAEEDGWWECRDTRVIGAWAANGDNDKESTNNGADCEDISTATGETQGQTPLQQLKVPAGLTGAEPQGSIGDPVSEG
jgi:hypothetical protein